jgi:hypothetical protein
MAADAQTYLTIHLEAAAWGEEAEGRRAERVGRGKHDAPVVDPGAVGGGGGPAKGEMPGEEVGFGGEGVDVGGRGGGELRCFADYVRGVNKEIDR